MAKNSDSDSASQKELKHLYRMAKSFWCQLLAAALVVSCWIIICLRTAVGGLNSSSSPELETPHPPQPYEYTSFMTWLSHADFAKVEGWKWKPEVAEFDLDAAVTTGKFAPHMTGSEIRHVLAVAKKINKFLFMGEIMRTGSLNSIGAPGTHMYILKTLAAATCAKVLPQPTFLDAGCGYGYLLLAWTQMCGPRSRAVGVDVDEKAVSFAKQYLASPAALDAQALRKSLDHRIDVRVGDALSPDASLFGLQKGSVDAVNVGLAVKSFSQLSPLVALLRVDGLLLAPICLPESEQPKDVPSGKCEGRLRLYRKSGDDTLIRVAGDPEIPCRFVVSTTGF